MRIVLDADYSHASAVFCGSCRSPWSDSAPAVRDRLAVALSCCLESMSILALVSRGNTNTDGGNDITKTSKVKPVSTKMRGYSDQQRVLFSAWP